MWSKNETNKSSFFADNQLLKLLLIREFTLCYLDINSFIIFFNFFFKIETIALFWRKNQNKEMNNWIMTNEL